MIAWESMWPDAPVAFVAELRALERRVAAIESLIASGYGSPEGVKPGRRGMIYERADGGTATCLYVFEGVSGSSTGWIAK